MIAAFSPLIKPWYQRILSRKPISISFPGKLTKSLLRWLHQWSGPVPAFAKSSHWNFCCSSDDCEYHPHGAIEIQQHGHYFFCYIHQYFWRPMGLTWPLQWYLWMFDIITCNLQVFNLALKILADTFRHSFILSALGSSVWFHFSLVKLKIISLIFLLPHNLWGEILGMCQRFFLPLAPTAHMIFISQHTFFEGKGNPATRREWSTPHWL